MFETSPLYIPGCPRIRSVNQVSLEFTEPPTSASQALGLKVSSSTPGLEEHFVRNIEISFFKAVLEFAEANFQK